MSGDIIRARQLSKQYIQAAAEMTVLDRVDLDVQAGEFLAVMGPSGSGKSTLLNLLGLLDTPSAGNYRLGGEDTASLHDDQRAHIRNRRIGFVFQGANLLPRSTAFENVELPLVYAGVPPRERRSRALEALASVGLSQRAEHWPQALSGGEQQRVAIARAVVNRPLLILADEPTGALDSQTGAEVLGLFEGLHRAGSTIVLVTHDPVVARRASRVVSLKDGAIVSDNRSAEPALHDATPDCAAAADPGASPP